MVCEQSPRGGIPGSRRNVARNQRSEVTPTAIERLDFYEGRISGEELRRKWPRRDATLRDGREGELAVPEGGAEVDGSGLVEALPTAGVVNADLAEVILIGFQRGACSAGKDGGGGHVRAGEGVEDALRGKGIEA